MCLPVFEVCGQMSKIFIEKNSCSSPSLWNTDACKSGLTFAVKMGHGCVDRPLFGGYLRKKALAWNWCIMASGSGLSRLLPCGSAIVYSYRRLGGLMPTYQGQAVCDMLANCVRNEPQCETKTYMLASRAAHLMDDAGLMPVGQFTMTEDELAELVALPRRVV